MAPSNALLTAPLAPPAPLSPADDPFGAFPVGPAGPLGHGEPTLERREPELVTVLDIMERIFTLR
jgi:hypothetical protein